jgi:AbrB family looped-hinge helix DNA binding protein
MKERPTYVQQLRPRTSVTRKGQVTLPAVIRRQAGLRAGDQVAVDFEKGHVRLSPVESTVDGLYGAFATNPPPLSAKELRRLAEDLIAEDGVRRSGA